MKKIISILIFSVFVLNITGCNQEINNENVEPKEDENIEIKENIDDSLDHNENDLENKDEEQTDINNSNKIDIIEEQSCVAKKFDNTYSYVYSTKEECNKNGYAAFDDVSENIDDTIFSFGCREIIDECGTTWYGVYFNRYSDGSIINVYY